MSSYIQHVEEKKCGGWVCILGTRLRKGPWTSQVTQTAEQRWTVRDFGGGAEVQTVRFQCSDAWLPSRVRALRSHMVRTEKKRKKTGWVELNRAIYVQRKELWGDWYCLAAGGSAFGGRHVDQTEAGDLLVGEALWGYKKLSGWVGDWKSFWLPKSQLLLDLQTETPQVLVKIMPAQCGLKFISLTPSLICNHKFFAGAQYDAETALHASWQDCGPVRQGEINSWENPREGNEEERVNTVDFLLEDFCLFMFCLFPQFSCLFRPRKNLVLAVFSLLKMISENKRPTKLEGVTEVERGALFKFYRCWLMK